MDSYGPMQVLGSLPWHMDTLPSPPSLPRVTNEQLPQCSVGLPPALPPPPPASPSPQQPLDYPTVPQCAKIKVNVIKRNCKTYKGAQKGEIIVTPQGVKKKFNGKHWRTLCSVVDCWKQSHKCLRCKKHLKQSLVSPTTSPVGSVVAKV